MLMIRLRRMGTRNRPFYRMVVSDSKKVPTTSAIDEVGFYNPRVEPVEISVKTERVEHWVSQGARMSPTVARLVRQFAAGAPAVAAETPSKPASKPAPEPVTEAKAAADAAAASPAEPEAEAEPAAEAEPEEAALAEDAPEGDAKTDSE